MTEDTDTAILFANVSKSYGPVRAVAELSMSVRRGETVAILGPNGAGKSTSINMLLGLFPPDSGRIAVYGTTSQAASRSGLVGAMLQDTQLVQRVTVGELITFVRGLYPDPMPTAEILRIAQLDDLVGRRLERLSGGQAQRVRFATAVAGRPELLVMDEPTAAMDVESRREFWTSMRAYARAGRTVLFSTHYLEEADENADRVLVIANGRLVADGTPTEIKNVVAGRTVSFDLADTSLALADLPGVVYVDVRAGRAHLTSTDSDATVRALADRDLIRGLEVQSARLEDAFMALTGHADPGADTDLTEAAGTPGGEEAKV
jgi:ABC-2 type transport system ATP-binding protein